MALYHALEESWVWRFKRALALDLFIVGSGLGDLMPTATIQLAT